MSLFKSLEDKKFDVRLLDFNLRQGHITQEQYDKFKAGLSDLEGQSVKVKVLDIANEPNEIQKDLGISPQNSTQNGGGFFGFNGGSSH